MTALDADERRRGVVAASTGNHGQGIAYGGQLLGVERHHLRSGGKQPGQERRDARARRDGRRGRARLRRGRRRDAAHRRERRTRRRALDERSARSSPAPATMTLEILEQEPDLDALVIAIGGGSQAVGAMTVARALAPNARGVRRAGGRRAGDSRFVARAPASHDAARRHVRRRRRDAHDLRSDVSRAARGARRTSSRSPTPRSPKSCARSCR